MNAVNGPAEVRMQDLRAAAGRAREALTAPDAVYELAVLERQQTEAALIDADDRVILRELDAAEAETDLHI